MDSITYFNFNWDDTTRDSAAYYRLKAIEGSLVRVRDYYISGSIQMEGVYSSLKPEIENGYFTWYFENGQKLAEGNYLHGNRDGIWTFWFPDGLKKEEIKFFASRENDFVLKWQSKRIKNSKHLFERAVKKKKRGKTEKALSLLNAVIQTNSYSAEAFYQKGELECISGNYESGCMNLLKAREYGYFGTGEMNEAIGRCCNR